MFLSNPPQFLSVIYNGVVFYFQSCRLLSRLSQNKINLILIGF